MVGQAEHSWATAGFRKARSWAAGRIPAFKKAKAGPREQPRQVQLQLTIPEVAPPGSEKINGAKEHPVG
jgi:hypothetical protein